ncbi:VOC family protein [Seonamhaeicola sp.]|uniref:VOC family protein n=1 Tax=Seonamhaeicola sp. TaxID=1912245 RepID=UPI002616864E|nr:VOC family protein [Seonamhaeicola sp.]
MKAHTYLHFNGNCETAMNFYKDVLDGTMTTFMRFGEAPEEAFKAPDFAQNWVMHCTLEFGGTLLMASDYLSQDQDFVSGSNFAVSISVDDEAQGQAICDSLAEGGKLMMPFMDAFWGGKFGMLQDKFGVHWMVSCDIDKV